MRRFNLLFVAIPVVFVMLIVLYKNINRKTISFYGVADNQETQINLDHASTVSKIYVTNGELVSKGGLLMELTRSDLDFKVSELAHDVEELEARDRLERDEIRGNLEKYKALKAEKIGDIQSKIHLLESERLLNENLYADLKSIPSYDSVSSNALYESKIQSLREQLRLSIDPIDAEIARLTQELRMISVPSEKESGKLKKAIDLYQKEKEQLRIYAPNDGLVGGIHCRTGENIPAFNTLISFYEQNPNMIVAYVHESLSLRIQVGDSLNVRSTLHPEEYCVGYVSGLGHRIVEIPERLRKIPEIKSYGREVLVRIPSNNHFLQKEKVVLQHFDTAPYSLLSLLTKPFDPGS